MKINMHIFFTVQCLLFSYSSAHWLEELERISSEPGAICFHFLRDFTNNKYYQSLLITPPCNYQGKKIQKQERFILPKCPRERPQAFFRVLKVTGKGNEK